MEYFMISQDRNLDEHLISFEGLKSATRTLEITTDQSQELKDLTVVFVHGENKIVPDFIDRPVVLVSDELKKVMEMHDDNIMFKCAVLTNVVEETQLTYWLILVDRLDCLSSLSEYDPWGRPTRIVIDKHKAAGHAVFRIAGIDDKRLIINLDVTESVLRRELWGMTLESIEIGEEE
ncbi:hypothetical protein OM416_07590 [Paenibacillus sp. LS1]|uniref:hypothetical protein n=1 Tax=Paenibacillus sp. LS1 TaxID=2992120 RepID=UPI00222E3894|nr:hypothetical protein [Paenibacillus sp. LS1]MCW3791437.1 hypothetical protein [Paenibacillus sp. LS1]